MRIENVYLVDGRLPPRPRLQATCDMSRDAKERALDAIATRLLYAHAPVHRNRKTRKYTYGVDVVADAKARADAESVAESGMEYGGHSRYDRREHQRAARPLATTEESLLATCGVASQTWAPIAQPIDPALGPAESVEAIDSAQVALASSADGEQILAAAAIIDALAPAPIRSPRCFQPPVRSWSPLYPEQHRGRAKLRHSPTGTVYHPDGHAS